MGCGSGGCKSGGCGSKSGGKGGCSTGGCNRLNVHNWLSDLSYGGEAARFPVIEISFNNGSRKDYHKNIYNLPCITGDYVVVETAMGLDIGTVSLTGELVRLQLKKKRIKEDSDRITRLMRIANEADMITYHESKAKEKEALIKARVMARDLGLAMKLAEVEFQGDGKKATFFYTADDRVDFRELIKVFARDFKVKIEMRQIGTRQEAGKVGGIGACGRELCCSTWLNDFKSVNTHAARYQQLAINQSKLSGQCGRLKCCLNYELDTYMDALKAFPQNAESLEIATGRARLAKTDIFRKKMHYFLPEGAGIVVLDLDKVKEILALNKKGEKPLELESNPVPSKKEAFIDYEDTVGQTSLSSLERMSKRNKKKAKPGNNNNPNSNNQSNTKNTGNVNSKAETSETKPENAPKNNPSQPRPQSSKPKPNFKKPSPPNTPANPDAANSPSPPVEPNDPANNTANKPNSTTKKTHFKPKPNNKGKNFIAPKPKDNDDKAK